MKIFFLLLGLLLCVNSNADQSAFVPVLMYHRTTDQVSPGDHSITLSRFEQHLQMLKREQYTTITISQLTDIMLGKTKMPNKAVVLTFDDGWRDNLDAAKVMEKYNISGTFFVCSGFFHDNQYVSSQDIHQISNNQLFEIGAHSHTHFMDWINKLETLDTRTMVGELVMSKRILEQITQKPVKSFAWPFGHHSEESIQYAAYLGFTSTVTVNSKSDNTVGADPLEIKRIGVNGNCTANNLKKMIQTGSLIKC